MSSQSPDRDGVFIDEAVHATYQDLTEGSDSLSTPFRTMKDVFMWAAALGYRNGERRPITGRRQLIFRWAQFTAQSDVPLLKAYALAGSDDLSPLTSHDAILTVAEEYANAGIHELRSRLSTEQGQPLWTLIDLIR